MEPCLVDSQKAIVSLSQPFNSNMETTCIAFLVKADIQASYLLQSSRHL